jgi:hypothetical protein
MEEPTVLDLFKSIFKDWRSFWDFVRSVFDAAQRNRLTEQLEEERQAALQAEPIPSAPEPAPVSESFPWRSALGLLTALLAQLLLEPPNPKSEMALGLYLLAIALVLWAVYKDEWHLTPLPISLKRLDPLTVRLVPLLLFAPFAVAAFVLFKGNLFTVTNVTLWLVSIGMFVAALWLPGQRTHVGKPRTWRQNLPWLLAGLVIAATVIFFRTYHIVQTPSEPFSDHAEKILDVYDVSRGQTHIFFPRNTGREAIQMYWTLLMSWIFGTGLSFLSLKIGTVIFGILTIPYVYLLGKEIGGKRVGLLAAFLMGVAYWPNVISRIGLRFPLYPLFAAPTLYYLLRGLRTQNRNDFIISGLFLGVGLHGYSPFRIVPIVVVIAVGVYWLHVRSKEARQQSLLWLVMLAFTSLLVFLPLLRYMIENPAAFSYRAISRLGTIETPLPGPWWQILLSNIWKGLLMFNLDDGEIWVNSIPHRPALGVISGALFLIGVTLLLVRYIRRRDWRDLFLLIAVPLLQLPSTLSLAYPGENPALNRSGGAAVVVFVIVALALDGLVTSLERRKNRVWGLVLAGTLTGVLLLGSAWQNYNLLFKDFDTQFREGAWNSSEMGSIIAQFRDTYGETDTVWIVPYPYWVDTRLPGVWAGIPNRDFALWPENLAQSLDVSGPKLFLLFPDDHDSLATLQALYPQGQVRRYSSSIPSHDFIIFSVPGQ